LWFPGLREATGDDVSLKNSASWCKLNSSGQAKNEDEIMPAVLKLLERQLGLWEVKRRLQDLGTRPGRCLEGNVAYGPCLLISRERGSGGGQVARLAGERLGWHVFDREIVEDIARLAHVREQLLESVDPETRANWDSSWQPELLPEDIGSEQYLRCLRQIVLALGHHGDVVMLGRGVHFLLPPGCSLRVRVVAPLELRVQRVAESRKIPEADASAQIQSFDASRTDFVRKCFRRDPGLALNYDLTINTEDIKPEAAVDIVLTALRQKLGVCPPKR
jgi:hypothetical protein